jgi:hypothetical protein
MDCVSRGSDKRDSLIWKTTEGYDWTNRKERKAVENPSEEASQMTLYDL